MGRLKWGAGALIPVLLAGAAGAQTSSVAESPPAAGPGRLSVTIYNQNIALVEERRALDLPGGRSRQEFRDVSAAIRPETVSLQAEGVDVVEQNFDYDLLTPDKLMSEAVGQEITIVRTNPGTGAEVREKATVLAVNEGVVLRIGERIEVLRDDGVPTRVIFDRVPPRLRARPTLSVTLDAERAGRREAVLSYLTTGLAWRADYVALFDERAGKLDLQGWITLSNSSGTSFAEADTQLVAGDMNLVRGGDNARSRYERDEGNYGQRSAGAQAGTAEPLADYYVYPLPGRTTIDQNQTKQVGFLSAAGVRGRKSYLHRAYGFSSSERPENVEVALEFANTGVAGLGAQLPAGIVRVYARDASGEAKFIGENRIDHTPAGSELAIKTGEAFDVTVQPTLVKTEALPRNRVRQSMSYLVRNARPEPVTVTVRQGGLWRRNRVLNESLPSRKLDAYTLAWDVPVPANGETTLAFTVQDER